MESKRRTVVIGDIHGCIDEFDELIKTLSYKKEQDRVILLGDLIDRGPDSVGVVRRAREMDLECVMGNHEHKFLKWYRSAGTNVDVYDKLPHYTQFSDEDVRYISQTSNYIKLSEHNIVVVHAGMRSGVPLINQSKDDLLYIRYTDSSHNFLSLKKINKLGKAATDARFWTEFWKGPESIIYGHNVHSYETPLIEEVAPGISCYGLDTGVCFGGRLTALVVETKEIIQVQAAQHYYQSRFNIR